MKAERLAQALGYQFTDDALLTSALTHSSYGADNNQRLEYLGDSVLNCIIAQALYSRFPHLNEGSLSRLRANLVRQDTLADVARHIALGSFLRLGEGERKSGGNTRSSNLADALEAVIGAVHLDGGFDAAQAVTLRLFAQALAAVDPTASGKDPKTTLQEALMAKKMALPKYALLETRGAAHKQEFAVECVIPELGLRCVGEGGTRRAAEQAAAAQVLNATKEWKNG